MPAPYPVDCPVCFETLKLKAAPKPGARLKCPHCSTVFSPGGDDEPAPVEDDEDDDVPVRPTRSKARGSATKGKKKKAKPVNLMVPIICGVIALVVIGGGIGLYAARDSLARLFQPSMDVSYCHLPVRSTVVHFKVQEFLNSPAATDAVKNGPAFGESSAALQELLGIETRDLTSMTAEFHLPAGLGPIPPDDGMIILRSSKAMRAPAAPTFDVDGVAVYRIDPSGAVGRGPHLDTMLLANRTTAVIGREATIRWSVANWKKGTRVTNTLPEPGSETVSMGMDSMLVTGMLSPISRMAATNPLMGGQMADIQQSMTTLGTQLSGVSFAGQLNGSAVNWSVSFYPRNGGSAEGLQKSVDDVRGKLRTPVDTALGAAALLPAETKQSLELAKQVLSVPLSASGNRVTMAVPIPADQQAKSLEGLASLIPSFKGLKVSQTAVGDPAFAKNAGADPRTTQAGESVLLRHGFDKTATVVFTGKPSLESDFNLALSKKIHATQGTMHSQGKTVDGHYVNVYGGIGDWAAFEQLIGQLGTISSNPTTRVITVTLDMQKANEAVK